MACRWASPGHTCIFSKPYRNGQRLVTSSDSIPSCKPKSNFGDPAPLPKRGSPQIFDPRYCGQRAAWIKMPLGMEVGLSPADHVLDGEPPPKKGRSPQFSADVYCGQTAGWIKMALGMKVGLGPGHIALDRDPAPLPKRGQSPQFSAHFYCGQAAGSIKMPLVWW